MLTTKHLAQRMSQRGITKKMIDLAMEYGIDKGDKIVLNRKITQKILKDLEALKKDLLKVMDKGGVIVICDADTLITTYNAA